MIRQMQITIPTLVRAKGGAIDRLGLYLARGGHRRVAVISSEGLQPPLPERVADSLKLADIGRVGWTEVTSNDLESSVRLFADLPSGTTAILGVGGGKALDVAKYVAFLSRLPYYAVPTSLSNDGFCSPQCSLTIRGRRKSVAASLPYGVIVDINVCVGAPKFLSLSGVGDLVAKFTAVHDWKLAFHHTGEPVDDFAALLSDGSIHSFLGHPILDADGMRLLATALMLNGIAMEICGSSRPASGSDHLISHALDGIAQKPQLHGLQVGMAAYIVSILQGARAQTERIAMLFDGVGFWDAISEQPFLRDEWIAAVRQAPHMKEGYYTILSVRDVVPEVAAILSGDPRLQRCFRD